MPSDSTSNVSPTEKRIADAALRLFADRGKVDVSVSDLATAAGVARGTLYRNVQSIDELFEQVLESAAVQLHARIALVLDSSNIADPAARLATALRLLVRVAHEDPDLGRFIVRFGLTEEMLFAVLTGPPTQDIKAGIATGRYTVTETMMLSVASLMSGATISAMWMVIEGHQAWRDAGSSAAELLLRALGVDPEEAARLAALGLPPLRAI